MGAVSLIIVKLGGSVITDKNVLRKFRKTACARLCGELRPAKGELVLVHGAGSYGHILAKKAKLHLGVADGDLEKLREVAKVHRDVRDLNSKVLACMSSKRLNGFSVPPYTVGSFTGGKMAAFCPEKFEMLIENDMIPVTFGDVVPDRKMNFSICSGDLLMLALAKEFKPSMAVFVADVDGVYDRDPKPSTKNAKFFKEFTPDDFDSISFGKKKNDVTDEMRGKLTRMFEIAKHCENTIILNGNSAGRLENALKGRAVKSTKVVA
jgi:isopentenyl phosphate kinase